MRIVSSHEGLFLFLIHVVQYIDPVSCRDAKALQDKIAKKAAAANQAGDQANK